MVAEVAVQGWGLAFMASSSPGFVTGRIHRTHRMHSRYTSLRTGANFSLEQG